MAGFPRLMLVLVLAGGLTGCSSGVRASGTKVHRARHGVVYEVRRVLREVGIDLGRA